MINVLKENDTMKEANKLHILLIGSKTPMLNAITTELAKQEYTTSIISDNNETVSLNNGTLEHHSVDLDIDNLQQCCTKADIAVLTSQPLTDAEHPYSNILQRYTLLLNAMQDSHIKRLIIVGGGGNMPTNKDEFLKNSKYFSTSNQYYFRALNQIHQRLINSRTTYDWIFMVPPEVIIAGERTGCFTYTINSIKHSTNTYGIISYQDFAMAVAQEIRKHQFSQTLVNAAY